MTFYQKLEVLCESRGITITALAAQLGFSGSAGTTWKKSKGLPRNSTLKKIADYFNMSVLDLKDGVSAPIDYDSVETDAFNQPVWRSILEQCGFDEHRAIDKYLEFEKAQMRDALSENAFNTVNGNGNIIGNGNTVGRTFTEQEKALLDIFASLDVVKQAQLLAFAAKLAK